MVSLLLVPGLSANAAVPAQYTTTNFWTETHDRPVSFSRTTTGGFVGVTESGKDFSQRPVLLDDFYVRLHYFAIDEVGFYISNRGVIEAPSDIVALSMYLSRLG
jgi:hypothetical protein